MSEQCEKVTLDLSKALGPITEKWKEVGRIILETIREITLKYMKVIWRKQELRGRFVHRHKGKPLRQHRMPMRAYRQLLT